MKQESIEVVGAKVAAGVTYAGSGGAVLAGLTLTEWGVIVGIITAIVGLVMQAIFGWRREEREQREHAARMARLRGDGQ